jgi:hypothetical protein
MKRQLFFLFFQIFVINALLAGLLLLLVSFQPFETLAALFNKLASDGQFETFNLSIYQALKLPLALAGIALALVAGFILFRWDRTKQWLLASPGKIRIFLSLLGRDTRSFFEDAGNVMDDLGRGGSAALVSLMLVALILRLGNLDLPLGHDEAYMYNAFASRSLWHLLSDYHLPNNHVFLSVLMHATTRLLGDSIWAIRLPTIVTGVLLVPAAFWFAKRFYSRETALLSAALVTIFPILIEYSVNARGYILVALFTLLIWSLGDYVRVKRNRFAWALIVILSTLGFFTIPIMLFPFGALYLWLLGSWVIGDTASYGPKSDFLKYWLASGLSAALLTVILYTPIFFYSFGRFFGNGFIAPLGWDIFPETIWTRFRNTWADWTISIPIWLALLGVLGFLVALVFHKKWTGQKFPPQLAFLSWILALLLVRRPDMLPRFWLFLAPPILTWAAAGIVEPMKSIRVRAGKRWGPAQVVVGLILALVALQALVMVPAIPVSVRSNDGMAKISLYLKDNLQDGDLVTATSARLPALRYYFDRFGLPKGYIRPAGPFQRAFIIVDDKKLETLETIAPQLGFGIPAIDMKTVEIVYQQDDFTVYKAYPVP